MADTDREPANQDSQQRAALFRDMLLDALHAMRSMDEVESLAGRDNKARSPEGILERIGIHRFCPSPGCQGHRYLPAGGPRAD